ncbi:hypothetical protein CDEST_05265 [Colletotrichum destructivum]|uniref:Uncharacterized protein n=1 Tax=Colletotrichum destructivum TaxID=34406 RepID=A0AAX4IAN5_9PEZI|nr:hypothetical protein CDEST_05265 [Colletotrichum destructivum]
MTDSEPLAAATRAEILNCFDKTPQKPRMPSPMSHHLTQSPKSLQSSVSFTDSGYSSPDDPILSQPQEILKVNVGKPLLTKGIPVKLGGQSMLRFKRPPDKPTVERFNEIVDRIQPLLVEHIKKYGGRTGPIALRSMVLGTPEESAQEHIVVLCPGQMLEVVESFFEKNVVIKELCKPSDPEVPTFKVVIEGRGPRLTASLAGVEVFTCDDLGGLLSSRSLCGLHLRLLGPNLTVKTATCGGVIKVVGSDGISTLYGLTAGHSAFLNEQSSGSSSEIASDQDENKDVNSGLFWQCMSNPSIGRVLESKSSSFDNTSLAHDWALIELNGFYKLGANAFGSLGPRGLCYERLLTNQVGRLLPGDSQVEVETILGGGIPKPGVLSNTPTRILMEFADSFTQSYVLTLNEGEVAEGDSGAWVVGSSIVDVFGHVVATDMFGDAYVFPLDETFQDIKISLGAKSVHLPSLEDFTSPKLNRPSSIDRFKNSDNSSSEISPFSRDSGYPSFPPNSPIQKLMNDCHPTSGQGLDIHPTPATISDETLFSSTWEYDSSSWDTLIADFEAHAPVSGQIESLDQSTTIAMANESHLLVSDDIYRAIGTDFVDSTYGSCDPSPEMNSFNKAKMSRYSLTLMAFPNAGYLKIGQEVNTEEDRIGSSKRPRLDEDSKPAQVFKRRKAHSQIDSNEDPKAK